MSRHPLFPAIVALWFGALFGLGSLAVRPALIEQAVIAGGIDGLIPAAAPPLGTTTRILIALVMTGLGAVLGGSLARRIARPAPEVRQRRRGAASVASEMNVPRALSRDDYFGAGAGLDADQASDDLSVQGNKRRSLALSDDFGPLEIHETAPVPGSTHGAVPVAAWDIPAESALQDEAIGFGSAADEPADEAGKGEFSQAAEPFEPLDLAEVPDAGERPFATGQEAAFAPPSFAPPSFAAPEPAHEASAGLRPFAPPAETTWFDAEAPEPEAIAAPDDEALPVSSEDHKSPEAAEKAPAAPFAPPLANEARIKPALIPPVGAAAERLITSDFDDLSPVQLVERLAISLQRRRQAIAASAVPALEAHAPRPDIVQPAAAPLERLGQAPLQPFMQPPAAVPVAPIAMPAAFRPLDFELHGDEDETEDETALDFLPPRQFAWQAQTAAPPLFADRDVDVDVDEGAEPDAEDTDAIGMDEPFDAEDMRDTDEDVDLEESYSSLLDLSRPAANRASFIRIEDAGDDDDGTVEPVVVFPGQRTPLATPITAHAAATGPATDEPAQPLAGAARLFDRPSDSSAMPARSLDQEAADRALRAALATLQRMSGAA